MERVLLNTNFQDLKLFNRGKVRDIYDLGDKLLIITTDRISVFDSVLPNGIPNKGRILTQLSVFWFNYTKNIIKNHLITADIEKFPEKVKKYSDVLNGRSMLVEKAKRIDVECVVRGYLTGSAWNEYRKGNSICGISLPRGLRESERLSEPIFTPAIKMTSGHDINVNEEKLIELIGAELTNRLREKSLEIYKMASRKAEENGIIIADTKFEFGLRNGELILIDELLTPDSSRFWLMDDYSPGKPQKSLDKQFVRDYLQRIRWNKEPPAPKLPEDIVRKTSERYLIAYKLITGNEII